MHTNKNIKQMNKKKKTQKRRVSVFNKAIKIRTDQHIWILKNKDTRTMAGFLDKIINYYKNNNKNQ